MHNAALRARVTALLEKLDGRHRARHAALYQPPPARCAGLPSVWRFYR